MAKSSGKPKGRKGRIGKKKGQMLAYRNEQRREKSHIRRIGKHLQRFKDDLVAQEALKTYKRKVGLHA